MRARGQIVQGVEVSLRKRLFWVAGVAAVWTGAALAQAPGVPASTSPASSDHKPDASSQTVQQLPAPGVAPVPPSLPTPVPEKEDQIQTRPAYGQQPVQPLAKPAPVKAGAPVPLPGQVSEAAPVAAYRPYGPLDEDRRPDRDGSTYIPLDSWIYPAMTRLYSLGYVDTMFLGMRPWTRKSVQHMLDESEASIRDSGSDEAESIFEKVSHELQLEYADGGLHRRGLVYGVQSEYVRAMGISGPILRDSYHLGQTINNDYARPYQKGFNLIAGASTVVEYGPFSLYVRGEYQHAPSATGYSLALSQQLSIQDAIVFAGPNLHQATIPTGPIAAQNPFRLQEAVLSVHLLGNEISGGKSDAWLGPAQGGALAWSNNAENIYSFRINRVEPLHIPLISRVLGPMRYDFFYGSLKGHSAPNSPYTHSEIFSFRPTKNFEFAFQRTIIFGGKDHSPVTLHAFLKSFFDTSDTTAAEKNGRNDPGARFSDFTFSYRLPFARKYLTLYTDSLSHDDVTPPSAPRRAAYRTGIYLSQIPGARKMDLRIEGVTTDQPVLRSMGGSFTYFEGIQLQGYTNKGFIMGDWIGREGKGGQAWLTYHLSGNEMVQLEYLNKKSAKDFILGTSLPGGGYGPGGTTQNSFKATVVKRFHHDDVELNAWYQYERWKAPVYLTGQQSNSTTAVQVTFFPGLRQKR